MVGMNIFRILGDVSHTLSKCILIFAIHRNQSTEGVSLITQALYCCVFISRYLDIFQFNTAWNTILKIFYILSSLYILFLMLRVYARTREREKAWKLGAACLAGSAIGAPLMMMMFKKSGYWGFQEFMWTFSIILESTCVLPQLLLLRQTTVPTVIDSYYLLTLGSYRAFYILNWIWRELDTNDRKPDPVSIIFGIVQTAFYVDFAWVYYSRQRVKLRHGGLVDADDLRNGWLLRTVFGHKPLVGHVDDEESTPALGRDDVPAPRTASKWGSRGISVSADDGVLASERERQKAFQGQEQGVISTGDEDPDAKMRDPDELARILDDDEEDGFEDDDGVLPSGSSAAVGNGSEWREGDAK
ncbi:related to endoplasmic reticulum retention receptor [Rhynchosporium secalis]|uniref:Related to endoplasmic reticulum retention receptor n=1 Tax=Rhynchosporium secalis TaxID=38038 RepID=A0A1E1LU69_RHYSE|nr:related to endoplasmic reticulum retention receptor [Rhynchosporium secalis]